MEKYFSDLKKNFFLFLPFYEGDDSSPDDAGGTEPNGSDGGGSEPKGTDGKRNFSQEQVNAMLATEKRKWQEQQQKTLKELEQLQQSTKLTVEQKANLEKQIEELRTATLTAEEKADREKKKLQKELESKEKSLSQERDTWKSRYENTLIDQAISEAAVQNNAFSPAQIKNMLRNITKVTEKTDAAGQTTGEFEVRVDFPDVDKEGRRQTMSYTVFEAVKRMKELPDEYGNLFKGEGQSGLGGTNTRTGQADLGSIKTLADYKKVRNQLTK